jgi:hypothetical protein
MTLFPLNSQTQTSPFVCDPTVDDWPALIRTRPNLLLTGPREATNAFLLAFTPFLQLPVRRVPCRGLRKLPQAGGTVILDDVETLDGQQQQAFLWWLDEYSHTGTQVISIAPTVLYNHVQAGTFLDALYYRLNVMYLEVSPLRTEL